MSIDEIYLSCYQAYSKTYCGGENIEIKRIDDIPAIKSEVTGLLNEYQNQLQKRSGRYSPSIYYDMLNNIEFTHPNESPKMKRRVNSSKDLAEKQKKDTSPKVVCTQESISIDDDWKQKESQEFNDITFTPYTNFNMKEPVVRKLELGDELSHLETIKSNTGLYDKHDKKNKTINIVSNIEDKHSDICFGDYSPKKNKSNKNINTYGRNSIQSNNSERSKSHNTDEQSQVNISVMEENNKQQFSQLDSLMLGFVVNRFIFIKKREFKLSMTIQEIKSFAFVDDIFFDQFYSLLSVKSFNEKNLNDLLKAFDNRYEAYFLITCYYYLMLKSGKEKTENMQALNRIILSVKDKLLSDTILKGSNEVYVIKANLLNKLYDYGAEDTDVISYYDLNKMYFVKSAIYLGSTNDLIKAYYEIRSYILNYNDKEPQSLIFLYYYGKVVSMLTKNINTIKDAEIISLLDSTRLDNFSKIENVIRKYKTSNMSREAKNIINLATLAEHFGLPNDDIEKIYNEGVELINKVNSLSPKK